MWQATLSILQNVSVLCYCFILYDNNIPFLYHFYWYIYKTNDKKIIQTPFKVDKTFKNVQNKRIWNVFFDTTKQNKIKYTNRFTQCLDICREMNIKMVHMLFVCRGINWMRKGRERLWPLTLLRHKYWLCAKLCSVLLPILRWLLNAVLLAHVLG